MSNLINFTPKNNFVVLEWLKEDKSYESEAGIIIADVSNKRGDFAKVLAVNAKTVDIAPGDIVVFDKSAGQFARIDGIEVLIVKETDIFAVME